MPQLPPPLAAPLADQPIGPERPGPFARLVARAQRFRAALAASTPEPDPAAPPPRLDARPSPEPATEQALPAEGLFMARADWADRLWDPGFAGPGGPQDVLRLSSLLPLSPATTLLMVGQDSGGAAAAIAAHRGTWIAFHQHDPLAARYMASRLQAFGKRISVQPWSPAAPAFRARFHQHALALEPLLANPRPEAFCQAVGAGLKSGGQFVLVELVVTPGFESDPGFARWLELEGRIGPPPSRDSLEAALQQAGFQIHVAEDSSQRHCAGIVEGFSRLVGCLRANRPRGADSVNALLSEAEAWLLRHRLLSTGKLAMLRWHASRRASVR